MKKFAAFRTPANLRFRNATLLCAAICASLLPAAAPAAAVNLTVDPATNNAAAVAELAGAIRASAANHHTTVINLFHHGVYTLTQPDNWEYGPNGLPQISSDLAIHGHGATILRPTNAVPFRFFYVSGGLSHNSATAAGLPAGSLTLRNLTLRGGLARGGNATGEGGGGAGMGGAIFNQGAVTLDGVTLTSNVAIGGSGGDGSGLVGSVGGGGGIGSDAVGVNGGGFGGDFLGAGGAGGAGNSGGGGGGGGFQPGDNGQAAGTNFSGAGGGLGRLGGGGPGDGGAGGQLFFGGPPVGSVAGAGYGFGSLGLANVFNNPCGGGGGIGGGGGHAGFQGTDGNGGFGGGGGGGGENGGNGGFGGGSGGGDDGSSPGFAGGFGTPEDMGGGGGGGLGGAIFNHRGSLDLANCTLTANIAQGGGGWDKAGLFIFEGVSGSGGSGYGGGIFNLNGTAKIKSCTIASNATVSGLTYYYFDRYTLTNAPTGGSDGGAFYNLAYGNHIEDGGASLAEAAFQNTILADSVGSAHDLANREINGSRTNTALVLFNNHNLVMSRTNFSGATSSNAPTVTADPKLGPLANNGGLTPTMALLPGSPAIDQGSAGGLTTDQRGDARRFVLCSAGPLPGDGSDIGAYEFDLPVLHIAGGPSGVVLSWSTAFPGCSLQATATPHLPATWASIACHPATVGCDFVVTNASPGGLLFYRLKVP